MSKGEWVEPCAAVPLTPALSLGAHPCPYLTLSAAAGWAYRMGSVAAICPVGCILGTKVAAGTVGDGRCPSGWLQSLAA